MNGFIALIFAIPEIKKIYSAKILFFFNFSFIQLEEYREEKKTLQHYFIKKFTQVLEIET